MWSVHLARLRCSVAWSNTSLEVAVKVFFRWNWHLNPPAWSEAVYPPSCEGGLVQSVRGLKGKDWGSGRGRNSASKLPSDERLQYPWVSSLLTYRFQTCQPHSCVSQFLKINLSLYLSIIWSYYWLCFPREPWLIKTVSELSNSATFKGISFLIKDSHPKGTWISFVLNCSPCQQCLCLIYVILSMWTLINWC